MSTPSIGIVTIAGPPLLGGVFWSTSDAVARRRANVSLTPALSLEIPTAPRGRRVSLTRRPSSVITPAGSPLGRKNPALIAAIGLWRSAIPPTVSTPISRRSRARPADRFASGLDEGPRSRSGRRDRRGQDSRGDTEAPRARRYGVRENRVSAPGMGPGRRRAGRACTRAPRPAAYADAQACAYSTQLARALLPAADRRRFERLGVEHRQLVLGPARRVARIGAHRDARPPNGGANTTA